VPEIYVDVHNNVHLDGYVLTGVLGKQAARVRNEAAAVRAVLQKIGPFVPSLRCVGKKCHLRIHLTLQARRSYKSVWRRIKAFRDATNPSGWRRKKDVIEMHWTIPEDERDLAAIAARVAAYAARLWPEFLDIGRFAVLP